MRVRGAGKQVAAALLGRMSAPGWPVDGGLHDGAGGRPGGRHDARIGIHLLLSPGARQCSNQVRDLEEDRIALVQALAEAS